MIQLPEIAAGASTTGEMGGTALAELQKALTAGYGTDVSTLQGGGALRIQSSAQGLPIQIVYGTTRVAGNLIYYTDFTPISL